MILVHLFTLIVAIEAQTLPGTCSFESSTCAYSSDPSFASWILNQDEHYLTVDASLLDGQQRAVLVSPSLEQQDWSCLRLVYQITGLGSLQMLQRTEGENFDRTLWTTQTSSDSWLIATIDLQNTTDPYQIVIEGRPGESPGSSVAILEIHIQLGYCIECDFEESHLCGYTNQWNANVNWYVGGGMVRDSQSNLPDDHTRSNGTGHYMYVDSVFAKTFQEVAKLVSPMTMAPLHGCLSFLYQRDMELGNLFLVFTRDQMGQYQELWRADPAGQSQESWETDTLNWIPVQLDFKAPYPVQVVFEVAFNSPRGGHVALDDISFSPEFCSAETEPTFDPSIANCDFEAGFCHYTQDQLEGPMWKRMSVRPNIFRTGDHTTGSGSFLLANMRLPSHSSYVSRLHGPLLPGKLKYCLRFYYSLRGFAQTDQALAVYLYDQSGKPKEMIWTQNEKSSCTWIGVDITFQSPQATQVVFLSTCKNLKDCGSVALDDLSVSLGDCELTAGFPLSFPGHCNFETGQCEYTQDKEGDTDDWVRMRGPTPTSYTGPTGDHTTGVGYYLYVEASLMLPNQNARLFSGNLHGSRGPQCLWFYYHMYGSGTGQLSVFLHREGEDVLLWKRNGEQGISWLRATVEYQCEQRHQIVFEATRGSSIRSDIAIDDITFERGPCPDAGIKSPYLFGNVNEIE